MGCITPLLNGNKLFGLISVWSTGNKKERRKKENIRMAIAFCTLLNFVQHPITSEIYFPEHYKQL